MCCDLCLGMKVIDIENNVGFIEDMSDLHNVWVRYESGGYGIYCQINGCESYDPLRKYVE